MNLSISSKADYYRNRRNSMDKYNDSDSDDFPGFRKLGDKEKDHKPKKMFIRSIFCKNKRREIRS